MPRLEEDEDRPLLRVCVDLRRVARAEVLERIDVCGVLLIDKGDVDPPSLDSRDAAARAAQSELDLVGEPVRAGCSGPHAEVRVADERERPSWHVALDHVGPRRGDRTRPLVPVRRAARDWYRQEA